MVSISGYFLMKNPNNVISGWLCLDKPEKISSNFAMIKVRRIFNENTGYMGTLDPFATGVLPIAVGEVRKFINFVNESEKIYVFKVIFGTTTDSLDKCGKITATTTKIPEKSEILNVLKDFTGEIDQIPPIFSAIKKNGARACDRARRGIDVELSSRTVRIFDIKMVDEALHEEKSASFEVRCSKGTYVRSLARDIAEKTGSLAYVDALRRTKSGFFSIKDAIPLEKLLEMKDTKELIDVLIPAESPLDDIPALHLGSEDVARLQNGLQVLVESSQVVASNVRIFDTNDGKGGAFCGIGFISADGFLKPVRMCVRN
jgi:tRNA pseudouridine55 synthase